MKSQDVILGILMKSSMSGYDMKRNMETIFSHFYNASYGTIYPTLNKMEKDGLITKESFVQEGKPNKNVYTITDEGRQAFFRYLESDIQKVEVKSDFMVRLFFGEWAEPNLVKKWLEDGIRDAEQTLTQLYGERERWRTELSSTQLICLNIGIANTEGILQNLKEGLANIATLSDREWGSAEHGSVSAKSSI